MRACMQKLGLLFLAASLLLGMPMTASAHVKTDYILDASGTEIRIPVSYTFRQVMQEFSSAGSLKNAQDLFIDTQNHLYVADTGNHRVLKLDLSGTLLQVYTGPEDRPMKEPNGVYVDADGDLFVADTGNRRVLHLAPDGAFVEEFGNPESDILGQDFVFEPQKVYVNKIGYLTVLKRNAFFTMDAGGQFRGYVGATQVDFDLGRVLIRMFASETQRERIRKQQAVSYSNFVIDQDGMIYATVPGANRDQIMKISSVGTNIYPSGRYGEKSLDADGRLQNPNFTDLAVDANGIISALDKANGKIYQYSQEGDLLAVFGGLGSVKGTFQVPVSIAVDGNGALYVLDSARNHIQVMEPTAFIRNVHQASAAYSAGRYDESRQLWEEILRMDETYILAHTGMGNAFYKEEQWEAAMTEYKLADNAAGYSNAFSAYRHMWFRSHFGWCVAGIAALAAGLVGLFLFCRRIADGRPIRRRS